MGLRAKFNITLGFCMLIGFVAVAAIAHTILQKNAREEVLQSAGIMMQSALTVRSYTVKEIKPLLAVQQRRQFIPQSVPAYAAAQYISILQEKHPEYYYKEAALNPTNPADRAADWEADIIHYFRNNREQRELIGERDTPAGPVLYMSRAIEIKDESCLSCHGVPSEAPQTFLDTYGSANGFGWDLGEIIGAQIVSVPMSVPLARAQETFMLFSGAIASVFAFLFIMMNLMLNRIVIKPVKTIAARADKISMGDLSVEELTIKGKDEMSILSRAFNRMHRSLKNAVNLLDEMEAELDGSEMTRVATKVEEVY